MKTFVKRIVIACSIALLTGVLVLTAKTWPDFFFGFYSVFSMKLQCLLSDLTAFYPYAVWEILALIAIVAVLVTLVLNCKKKNFLGWLGAFLIFLSSAACFFIVAWGLNYYAPSVITKVGLEKTLYTPEELLEAATYYMDEAGKLAPSVERDAEGYVAVHFEEMSKTANQCFDALQAQCGYFDCSRSPVKRLLISPIMGWTGTTGVFIGFTGESGVSDTTYCLAVPFNMCHEIGHRCAIAREDEASIAAFLACFAGDDPAFRYSAYYEAFIYCNNALYSSDPSLQRQLVSTISPLLLWDIQGASKHYDEVEVEVASKAFEKVYDQYLQSFDVKSGIQSYGEVTDLLVMYYFQKIKGNQ